MEDNGKILLESPYKQPCSGGISEFFGEYEHVGFLPGTKARVWYTHLPECFPNHWHSEMEIIVGEHGYYEMGFTDKTYHVHANEILIIPSGTLHSLTPHNRCNGFVYFVDLNILHVIKSAASVMSYIIEPVYITEKTPALHHTANTLLKQMRHEYFSDDNMREFVFYSHFLNLIAEVSRHSSADLCDQQHSRADKRKEYSDIFNDVLNYINSNYMKDLTIEAMSQQYGFSKCHFSRLFKQYTHYNFSDYLNLQRVRAAEVLLSQLEMSVTDIAFRSGFSSLPNFNRVFKNKNNCTPSEYRRIYSK